MADELKACFILTINGDSCIGCRFLAKPLTEHGIYVCRAFLGGFKSYHTNPKRCQACYDAEMEYKEKQELEKQVAVLEGALYIKRKSSCGVHPPDRHSYYRLAKEVMREAIKQAELEQGKGK